jgi:hypothetical protein
LTSRTFEKAWRARARYRRDLAGFSTWLFTIAKNVRIDYYGRRSHLPIDAALNAAAEGTPEQEAERRSNLARLAVLTESLHPASRGPDAAGEMVMSNEIMNGDFLHRLRAEPSTRFLAALKAKLDAQGAAPPASRRVSLRTLAIAIVLGGAGVAMALVVSGEIASWTSRMEVVTNAPVPTPAPNNTSSPAADTPTAPNTWDSAKLQSMDGIAHQSFANQADYLSWKQKNIEDDPAARTADVGSFPEGASPYGALDMAGNAWDTPRTVNVTWIRENFMAPNTGRRVTSFRCAKDAS